MPLSKENDGSQCYVATHLRVDETTGVPAMEWCDWAGPHVVSMVDGSDLTLNMFKLMWYFVVFVRGQGEDFEDLGMTPQQAVTPQQFHSFAADLKASFLSSDGSPLLSPRGP